MLHLKIAKSFVRLKIFHFLYTAGECKGPILTL